MKNEQYFLKMGNLGDGYDMYLTNTGADRSIDTTFHLDTALSFDTRDDLESYIFQHVKQLKEFVNSAKLPNGKQYELTIVCRKIKNVKFSYEIDRLLRNDLPLK